MKKLTMPLLAFLCAIAGCSKNEKLIDIADRNTLSVVAAAAARSAEVVRIDNNFRASVSGAQ